ncbi:MAG: adenylosuccinate lyase [Tannerellaceae bacterium]|jgi:adenylosuccinate lyase|nr:adenylosuccinate lyase [Tannerellaceae bacterium]
MTLSTLTAISPIDGRYRNKTKRLATYFSEQALIKYRVQVEVEYFIALTTYIPQLNPLLTKENKEVLRNIYRSFGNKDAERIKDIEKTTNHDVKAVEYYLKEKLETLPSLRKQKEYIHFGLTSQDINNTAVPLSLKDALNEFYYPELQNIINRLNARAEEWKDIPMLARTHGQPASPTRLGKEVTVFAYRLEQQIAMLKTIPISAKFGGATGNFNAHQAAYPQHDWQLFGNTFVNQTLGLSREACTTQISNYDHLAAIFDGLKRINTILIDLSRDLWQYISMEYFKQKIKEGETGSSTMPHKVNPIDFENAEGNLGIANAILEHLAQKLPISRLQRDLTDSTVLRNIGVPMAHTAIAFESLTLGLDKLLLNKTILRRDLEQNPAVVTEGIQTILRREGYPEPYEALKALARNKEMTMELIHAFIDDLNIAENIKTELKTITPYNYTGI